MPWAIKLVDVPDAGYSCRIVNPWASHWLASYDPDAMQGLGEAVFAPDESEAMRFETFDAAKDCWFQQSSVLPLRAVAGREFENRPLSVVSISIDEIWSERDYENEILDEGMIALQVDIADDV